VGGPYRVTISQVGYRPEVQNGVTLTLGVTSDLRFLMAHATVELAPVTVTAPPAGAVFSSERTGAATTVTTQQLSHLPTISRRVEDLLRLTPQYTATQQPTSSGALSFVSFAGQDNRLNNMTVDGSYFNNSFGLGGQPGDRTNVAPISLEAIEQVQVSVAPYDVRQGNFVGAGVNTVTRSGTNNFVGSGYYRYRNESFVGTEAKGQAVNPGTFKTTNGGEWLGGPIVQNKLFFFESFESQKDTRPLTT